MNLTHLNSKWVKERRYYSLFGFFWTACNFVNFYSFRLFFHMIVDVEIEKELCSENEKIKKKNLYLGKKHLMSP